jgi:hypothetical protein
MVEKRQREYLQEMILTELANGLKDADIIRKLQIPQTSYYRFKRALSNKIGDIQLQVSETDIALANEIYEQRVLKGYINARTKADKEDCEPEWETIAQQLAANLLVVAKNGLIEATTKRHDYEKNNCFNGSHVHSKNSSHNWIKLPIVVLFVMTRARLPSPEYYI